MTSTGHCVRRRQVPLFCFILHAQVHFEFISLICRTSKQLSDLWEENTCLQLKITVCRVVTVLYKIFVFLYLDSWRREELVSRQSLDSCLSLYHRDRTESSGKVTLLCGDYKFVMSGIYYLQELDDVSTR